MKSRKRRPTATGERESGVISRHYPVRQDDRDLNLNHSLAVLRGFAEFCQLTGFNNDRNYLAKAAS